jgi:hypothetical protein
MDLLSPLLLQPPFELGAGVTATRGCVALTNQPVYALELSNAAVYVVELDNEAC